MRIAGVALAFVLLTGLWMVLADTLFHSHWHHAFHMARAQLRSLDAKIHAYRYDHGHYPEALAALALDTAFGPYAKPTEFIDPWGAPLYYRVDADRGSFVLFTLGEDGRLGGDRNARDIDAAAAAR